MKPVIKTKTTQIRAVVLGLALVATLALTISVAAPAEAKKAVPALKKGVTNLAKTVTTLAGFVSDDPVLRLDNDSPEGNATALDLRVEPGKAPMSVDSDAKVDNLNADKVDGLDSTELKGQQGEPGPRGEPGPQGPPGSGLSPDQIYSKDARDEGEGGGQLVPLEVSCDPGDKALGGGSDPFDPVEDELRSSDLLGDNTWISNVKDNGDPDFAVINIICADFGEPHQD